MHRTPHLCDVHSSWTPTRLQIRPAALPSHPLCQRATSIPYAISKLNTYLNQINPNNDCCHGWGLQVTAATAAVVAAAAAANVTASVATDNDVAAAAEELYDPIAL